MNLVQLEQRSLTEWIQLAKVIWVALNSDLIRLMWSTMSEPGLTPTTLAPFEITIWIRQHYIWSSLTHFTYYFLIRFNSLRKSPFTEIWRNPHNESKVIVQWATKTYNFFFNIAAERVEKQCCMFYRPCSNLSSNKWGLLQVASLLLIITNTLTKVIGGAACKLLS